MEGVRKPQWGMEALELRSPGFGICHSFVCRADFICLISWKGGILLLHWSVCGLPHTVSQDKRVDLFKLYLDSSLVKGIWIAELF